MHRPFFNIGLCLSLCFLTLFGASAFADTDNPDELYWEDMVPKGFIAPEVTVDHLNNMSQASPNAPVLEELNNQFVKIPGFVVPLEGTAELTTEFLLVPYFGACIHVPPPPSNQIVYVTFKEGAPIDNLYDAVWVVGTLSTKGWSGDIASVGYTLEGIEIQPYE